MIAFTLDGVQIPQPDKLVPRGNGIWEAVYSKPIDPPIKVIVQFLEVTSDEPESVNG